MILKKDFPSIFPNVLLKISASVYTYLIDKDQVADEF